MQVLFISSGNKKLGISPIVKAQGESLIKANVGLNYYLIKGKGFKGYLKNLLSLRREIKNGNYDIIHSHYGDSTILAAIANFNKVKFIASFMGSDIYLYKKKVNDYGNILTGIFFSLLFRIIARYITHEVIVKSHKMKSELWRGSNITVLPNGVNMDIFKPLKHIAKQNTKSLWKILFIGDKNRPEKNYHLLDESVRLLKNDYNVEIINAVNMSQDKLNLEYNKAHVLVLTSDYEGSPNVIKEAMACNLPIVSTDVGDVKKVIGETLGCFIAKNNSIDFSEKLIMALQFGGYTKGRNRIIELGLDSSDISNKLIELYHKFGLLDDIN
jgi:glycosyltransferase involved in cell wall biosynthesis